MTAQKNVSGQTTTPSQIEFTLELSPEQYEIYQMLAKLNGCDDILGYIHGCLNLTVAGEIDSIEDPKERKRISALFGEEDSTLLADETVVIHGFYDAHPGQLKAVNEAAKVMGYRSPSEFIQSAIKGGVRSDIDHLGPFDGARAMDQTLKED